MGVILKNNAVSTITTAISASDVGLAVAAGTGSLFPVLGSGDYFYATLVSTGGTYEVIKVTARVNDTMTIVRAQEGTTAQSFASGSRLEARVTAASITDMVDEHDQASEISFAPTGNITATNVQAAIAELEVGYDQQLSGDGVQDTFATNFVPTLVFINGVYQFKNTYTIVGSDIVFSEAPPINSSIELVA